MSTAWCTCFLLLFVFRWIFFFIAHVNTVYRGNDKPHSGNRLTEQALTSSIALAWPASSSIVQVHWLRKWGFVLVVFFLRVSWIELGRHVVWTLLKPKFKGGNAWSVSAPVTSLLQLCSYNPDEKESYTGWLPVKKNCRPMDGMVSYMLGYWSYQLTSCSLSSLWKRADAWINEWHSAFVESFSER